MKKLFITLFFLFTLVSYSQQQNFQYKNTLLFEVVKDIEDRFNVRFSYKSSLLVDQKLTYKGAADLKSFLNYISEELNLEFIFLDDENIVVKSSFDQDFDTNALDEIIVVTEYLTAGFDKNKNGGSIIMNPNKLGILPGLTEPDILQSLQLLPGISSPTESASNLHIRGGTPDQNLILYDGIKVYHQGHLFGMISPFNPYVIESVNVFRSGTKSEFGDRIAGVIDINTMKEVPTKTSGGGGLNFLHFDAFVKTPLQKDKVGFLFSARRSINDLVSFPTFNSFSDKVFQNTTIEEINNLVEEEELTVLDNKFDFLDINTKLVFQPNQKNKISLSSLHVDNSLNYANEDSESYGTRDALDLVNNGFSVFWEYQPNTHWAFTSSLKFSKFKSDYKYAEFEDGAIEESYFNNNTVSDFGLSFQAKHKINSSVSWKSGYELVNYNVDYDITFNDKNLIEESEDTELTTHNVFSEIEYKTDNFYLRGGFRTSLYSQIEKYYLEPRLYMHYNLTKSLQVKASAEIKNQAISQLVSFDLNDLGVGNTVWVLTDEEQEIPVLNNKQLTFGFFFNKNGWKLDVESYFKKVEGLTSFTRGFSSNALVSDYADGNSTVFGIDVLLKKKINRFRTWLGYSYSKNDFEFPELQTGKFPGNFDQRHVISLTNSYKYKQFQFSLGWQFATGKPYSEVVGLNNGELVLGQQNQARLSNYHKLDASAFYDFHLDSKSKVKARFGVSIINIYNRDNEIGRTFNVRQDSNDNDVLVEQTNVGLGITPNIVFRVYF
tara:strand:- start:41739 stop:44063 length:2325 start_codon:yes stop_codon:yes gene_type:complete